MPPDAERNSPKREQIWEMTALRERQETFGDRRPYIRCGRRTWRSPTPSVLEAIMTQGTRKLISGLVGLAGFGMAARGADR